MDATHAENIEKQQMMIQDSNQIAAKKVLSLQIREKEAIYRIREDWMKICPWSWTLDLAKTWGNHFKSKIK